MIVKVNILGLLFLQEAVGFDLVSMWNQMGWLARAVVIILGLMSAWSIGVMIDRPFRSVQPGSSPGNLRLQLRAVSRKVKSKKRSALPNRTSEAIWRRLLRPACRNSELMEFPHELAGEQIESSRRACERAEAIVNAELKRGLSGLATIGATAPFVGLFGTTVGIINAFKDMSSAKDSRSFGSSRRYFGSARYDGIWSVRGSARGVGLQHLHEQG